MQNLQNGENNNSVDGSGIISHAAVLYGSDDDMNSSMIPLLIESISQSDRMCLCILDDMMYLELTSKLTDAGIDVGAAQDSEKLSHLIKTDVFLQKGAFDIEKTFAIFNSIAEASKAYGFRRLDIFTDMAWTLPKILNRAEYEVRLGTLKMPLEFHMYCLYDLRKFSSDAVMDALRTHSLLYANGVCYRNPFCAPPERLMHEDFSDLELEYALKIVREIYDLSTALELSNSGSQQMRDLITQLNGDKIKLNTELSELRLKFDQYSEGISDWIWELDAEGRFNYTSTAVTYILGMQREDILGRGLETILLEEDKKTYLEAVEDAKYRIAPFGPIDLHAANGGKTAILRISAVPLFHRSGTFLGYRGIAKDITAEINSADRIRELDQEVSRLVSSAEERENILQAELDAKAAEISAVNESISSLEEQIASKDAELTAASAELESEKASVQELQELLESRTQQINITATSLAAFKGEITRLSERLASQEKDAADEKTALEERISAAEAELAEANSELSAAKSDLAASRLSMEGRNAEILALTAAAAALADEKEELNAQIASVKNDLAGSTSEITLLMSEIEELKRYKAEASELHEKLAAAQAEAAELKTSLENKSSEIITLTSAAALLSEDKQSLAYELQDLKNSIRDTTSEMTASAAEIESLTHSNLQLSSKLKETNSVLEELKKSSSSEISALTEKIAALESDLGRKDAELISLQEELADKNSAAESSAVLINAKDEEIANMVALIASKEGELNELHDKISVMHSGLEAELAEIKLELKSSFATNTEAYYRLFDSSAEAVWIIDNNNSTIFANNKTAEMFRCSKEDLQNKKPTDFMSQEWLEGDDRKLTEERVIHFVRKDGSDLWVMVSSIPIIDNEENPRGMMGILVDITELKKSVPAAPKNPGEFMDGLNDALTAMLSDLALAKDFVIPEGRMYDKLVRAQEASEAAVKAVGYNKLPDVSQPLVHGQGRVLIIDDNDTVSEAISDLLNHLGYDPDFAADCEEGLTVAADASEEGRPFVAAILDINIPDCLDMMPRIAAACPGIKIIASDVLATDPIAADPAAFGFAAALAKPFAAGELSAVLNAALQS